ncbi:hypothetical protein ABTK60_19250, partial [Acinetobacter baumannii]
MAGATEARKPFHERTPSVAARAGPGPGRLHDTRPSGHGLLSAGTCPTAAPAGPLHPGQRLEPVRTGRPPAGPVPGA